jgi:transposase
MAHQADQIQLAEIQTALQQSKDKQEFQRVLCVWLKVQFSLNSAQIALAIGWKPSAVRNLQARFNKEGVQSFFSRPKGGRRHANISFHREVQILEKFARRAKRGFSLDVKQIQKAYELSVGRAVPQSTIYRMITRHGLRHFLPKARKV